jgi:hypothetical protein
MDGIAPFLLQTKSPDDVVLIEARKGDVVIIPPGYGHVAIHPTPDQTLTMARPPERTSPHSWSKGDRIGLRSHFRKTYGQKSPCTMSICGNHMVLHVGKFPHRIRSHVHPQNWPGGPFFRPCSSLAVRENPGRPRWRKAFSGYRE